MQISDSIKLLPLQGDRLASIKYPGRCPGLGASALSGRVELTFEFLVYTPSSSSSKSSLEVEEAEEEADSEADSVSRT